MSQKLRSSHVTAGAFVLFLVGACSGQATGRQQSGDQTERLRLLVAETTREILESEPNNAVALTEVGLHHAMSYRWYASFIAVKQPIFGGLRGTATREFNIAVDHLRRAIEADPDFLPAYRELIRVLIEGSELDQASDITRSLTRRSPRLADGWMYRGLLAQLQNRSKAAEAHFERGLRFMDPEEKSVFEDVSLFLDKAEKREREEDELAYDQSYWATRDPLYLTEENERKADHFARLAYADIWYGDDDKRGWETERGEIVARYGVPLVDLSFTVSMTKTYVPRFNVLGFGDFHFVFEDVTRGGHYTMYSPKAGRNSSWAFDYVIRSAEMARSDPELLRFLPTPRTSVLAQTSAFKGPDGLTDLYIHYAMPTQHFSLPGLVVDGATDIGGFITSGGEVVATSTAVGEGRVIDAFDRPHLAGTRAVTVVSGDYGLSVEYFNGDKSAFGVLRDSTFVPSWPDDQLSMSDILIASSVDLHDGFSSATGAIVRNSYLITPDPWSPLGPNGETLLYFEVYGLSLDESGSGAYHVEARLFRTEDRNFFGSMWSVFSGGLPDESVTVAFDAETTSADDVGFFVVGLSNQKEGSYDLSVTITDHFSGDTAESVQAVTISSQ